MNLATLTYWGYYQILHIVVSGLIRLAVTIENCSALVICDNRKLCGFFVMLMTFSVIVVSNLHCNEVFYIGNEILC